MANWIDDYGFKPQLIIQYLEEAKIVAEDGKVSFDGFNFSDNTSILTTMLNLNSQIPDVERRKIVVSAVFKAATKGTLSKELVINEASLLEKSYLSQSIQTFRLITNFSIAFPEKHKKFNIRSSQISIGYKISKKALKSRAEVIAEARRSIIGDLPNQYSTVSVIVQARNVSEAATRAIDDIDLIRSIWNFWKNRELHTRISTGASKPINRAILGPIHTLHTFSGEKATDSWWYESSYREAVQVWRIGSEMPELMKYTKYFRKCLDKIPYREELISALLQYTRALDSIDRNHTFLQLWSLLEQLTGTTQQESHKTTVKRASFVFADPEYANQALLHLRFYRNKSIHTGSEIENIEPLFFQLKRIVEALINFHIGRPKMFNTMAEAAEFMDSPNNRESLDIKIRKLQAVRKFVVA